MTNRSAAERFLTSCRDIREQLAKTDLARKMTGWADFANGLDAVADFIERACDARRTIEAGEARIAMLEQQVEKLTSERSCGETAWVSVDTKLPERGEIVVMFSEHKALKMTLPDLYWLGSYGVNEDNVLGWYDSGGDRVEGPGEEGFKVTHWQPLPSPPTGRTEVKVERK